MYGKAAPVVVRLGYGKSAMDWNLPDFMQAVLTPQLIPSIHEYANTHIAVF